MLLDSDFGLVFSHEVDTVNSEAQPLGELKLTLGKWDHEFPDYCLKARHSREEHQRIIAGGTNLERRDLYEKLPCTGRSQTDVASLHAEDSCGARGRV